jgi:hypothetical protein
VHPDLRACLPAAQMWSGMLIYVTVYPQMPQISILVTVHFVACAQAGIQP